MNIGDSFYDKHNDCLFYYIGNKIKLNKKIYYEFAFFANDYYRIARIEEKEVLDMKKTKDI